MLKSVIAMITAFSLFFGQLAIAAPLTLCPECKVYRLKSGVSAPEDGWLYSDLAQAVLLAEIDAKEKSLKNDYEYQLKLKDIEIKYITETSSAAYSALEKKDKAILKIKDHDIEFLEKNLIEANERGQGTDKMLWFSIGVGGGVLIALISAIAYAKVAEANAK